MTLLKTAVACVVPALLFATILFQRAPDAAQVETVSGQIEHLYVGERLSPDELHVLGEPGRYGLGPQIRGSRYGISHGQLIRFDPATFEVQSILRRQKQLPD
jgi:hypothetical protein